MAENKIVGYKNIFGFVLPDWVDEATIKLLVSSLLSVAAMLFVLIFFVWPKFTTINELGATLKTKESTLTSLKGSKLGFDKLSQQIPEATQNLILAAIPQTYSPENAIFMLRKIASTTPGLSIVSYSLPSGVLFDTTKNITKPTKPKEKEAVTFLTYPIRLTLMAEVGSLLTFVNKVETSLPLGVVSDLGMQEVTKIVRTVSNAPVQMDIEISFFQAVLNQVDISLIEPISSEDMTWVKKIAGFSRIDSLRGAEVILPSASVSAASSLFGF
jgi:hypothetical protein